MTTAQATQRPVKPLNSPADLERLADGDVVPICVWGDESKGVVYNREGTRPGELLILSRLNLPGTEETESLPVAAIYGNLNNFHVENGRLLASFNSTLIRTTDNRFHYGVNLVHQKDDQPNYEAFDGLLRRAGL